MDINLSMMVDQSYRELGYNYLDFDPSRLKQVLYVFPFSHSSHKKNIRAQLARPHTRLCGGRNCWFAFAAAPFNH